MSMQDDEDTEETQSQQPPGVSGTIDQELAANANRMVPLQSSWLVGAYYDAVTQTLDLSTASGRTYTLFGVPPDEFVSLLSASSPGQYFNANLKGKY